MLTEIQLFFQSIVADGGGGRRAKSNVRLLIIALEYLCSTPECSLECMKP